MANRTANITCTSTIAVLIHSPSVDNLEHTFPNIITLKNETSKSELIYKIPCSGRDKCYKGMIKQYIKNLVSQHKYTIASDLVSRR